jgi:hypothetical protein
MEKKTIRVAVSLLNSYGIGSMEKPGWPKMSALGWVPKRDTETYGTFGGIGGYPEFDKLIADNCRHGSRWGWVERAEIHDLSADAALEEIPKVFVIVKANVLARNQHEGTSWFARDAFINEENARKYCADRESQDFYCWIVSVSQIVAG